MKDSFVDNENGLTYVRNGDYYIPLANEESFEFPEFGFYGMLRLNFLSNKNPLLKSMPYLFQEEYAEISKLEEECWQCRENFIAKKLRENPAPSKNNTLAHVQHMNTLIAQINEVIFAEYIYI